MEKKIITSTQIQSIEAKELLNHFEKINNRLDKLQKTIDPKKETVLLTRKEVAKLLEVSLPTLWAWTNKNILISYRIGNKIRYKENEVFEALQSVNAKSK